MTGHVTGKLNRVGADVSRDDALLNAPGNAGHARNVQPSTDLIPVYRESRSGSSGSG
jgi:hypothetical protein